MSSKILELKEKLTTFLEEQAELLFYESMNTFVLSEYDEVFKDVELRFVKQRGGEGEGEEFYYVYQVYEHGESTDLYVKLYGFYQSFNGAEYTDWGFVSPVRLDLVAELSYNLVLPRWWNR